MASKLHNIKRIQEACPEAACWSVSDYLACDFRVAVLNGRLAGFLVARQNGPEEWEVLNLAVAPEYRRQGVARRLVASLQTSMEGSVFLEVRESNTAARMLYNSMGFQEVSVRRQYYDSPSEAAIVMKFHSC